MTGRRWWPRQRRRTAAFAAAVPAFWILALPSAAQTPAECATAACARTALPVIPDVSPVAARGVWQDAAPIHQRKLQFVAALRAFTEAQSGTFGDEGPLLRAAIDAMDAALTAWDAAIAGFEARAARLAPDADVDVAVASVYLDRLRVADALRQLAAAERHDDRSADIYVARALAIDQAGPTPAATAALRTAASLAPDDPATAYLLAQHERAQGRQAEAGDALRRFTRVLSRRRAASTAADAAPFARIDLLRETAGVAPLFPVPAYAAGYARLAEGRLADALAEFRKAAAADPLIGHVSDARLQVQTAGADLRQGKPAAAIGRLRALVAGTPGDAEAHRILGVAYWVDGEPGRAIEHLRTAIVLRSGDERARIALADVLTTADRLAEAERELTATLAAAPESGRAWYRIGRLSLRQAILPRAVGALRQALQVSPPIVGRDFLLQTIAGTLVNQADFDDAIVAHGARVEVNPNSALAHRQLGDVYFLQGRHDEALAEFSAAAWLDADDARAHAATGQVLVRLQRYADAVVALRRALALDGDQQEARYALAMALLRSGKEAEGRAELERFQRQQAAAQLKGRLEFELDTLRREAARLVTAPAAAVPLLQRALDMDPESPRSHRDLGLALSRVGDGPSARHHLESAQRLEPTADVASLLADLYRRAGMPTESARQAAERETLVRAETLARIRAWQNGP